MPLSNDLWLDNDMSSTLSNLIQSSGIRTMANSEMGGNHKVYVEHNYVDHYNDSIYRPNDGSSKRRGPRGGVLVPFPEKLYQMLNQIEEDGLDDVVSWMPHGRCFVVHQPDRFVKEVMPRYFSQTKLTSFQRQVNLYGFRRLTTGTDRNGYYHELFLRGRPDLLKRMTRVRVKGIGCKLAPSPATEPNFYSLTHCQKDKMAKLLLAEEAAPKQSSPIAKLSGSSSGFLEAYMASKLGQRHNSLQNSLFQEQVRRSQQTPSSAAVPCTPRSSATPMAAFSSMSSLPSFHPTDATEDDDFMPLPSGPKSYLTSLDNNMQDDIISLLHSCGDITGSNNSNNNNDVQPARVPSSGNILSDMANFWEI